MKIKQFRVRKVIKIELSSMGGQRDKRKIDEREKIIETE